MNWYKIATSSIQYHMGDPRQVFTGQLIGYNNGGWYDVIDPSKRKLRVYPQQVVGNKPAMPDMQPSDSLQIGDQIFFNMNSKQYDGQIKNVLPGGIFQIASPSWGSIILAKDRIIGKK